MTGVLAFEVTFPVVLLGSITGMTYGLLAVGLVVIYRTNRIINFAHGEIGAFGAAVLGIAVIDWKVPYWLAFVLALCLAGAVGAATELIVVRRLRRAPKVMSIVATLGVAQFLLLMSLAIGTQIRNASLFPQPPGLPDFQVGPLRVTPAYSGMLLLTPCLVLALTLFFRFSKHGLAMRAAAANDGAARLAGVFTARMSSLAWTIAGMISAFTAILVFPTRGLIVASSLGPGLLLRALVAAVIARLASLPIALGAGVALGVVEGVLLWNRPQSGYVDAVLLGVILAGLLLLPRREGRDEERGSWLAVQPWAPLSDRLAALRSVRLLGPATAALAFAAAVVFGIVATNSAAVTMVFIIGTSIVGLSVGILTGLAGQVSFGQFALAGVGAVVASAVASSWGNVPLAFVVAAAVTAGAALLLGLPALRIRGLMLAVTTLAFALATDNWLLRQSWALGNGELVDRPPVLGFALDSSKRYYVFSVAVLGVALWLARNVWRGSIGRRLSAVRDNEDAARAFGVSAVWTKMLGFAVAGMLAGIGGATVAFASPVLRPELFLVSVSVDVVAMAALGGMGLLAGPLIGAAYILGLPRFLPLDNAGLAATAIGWLALVLYFPGGIAQLLGPVRDRLVDWLARREGVDSGEEVAETGPRPALLPKAAAGGTGVVLEVERVEKSFGGLKAVDGVSFSVDRGQTLGVIGPNGAGKTTLFDLVSGFVTVDAGSVRLDGRDVTRDPPEARARLGLVRSFQDAALFPTMTVLDAVALALERGSPSPLGRSIIGLDPTGPVKWSQARELVHLMGLDPFRHKRIHELSTGTRRIAELACVLALQPMVLLLDEPSSGVAQREVDALGDLLMTVRSHLGATLVLIEHHIPLVMRLSDRIVAMESGRVIASGTPEEIRHDPLVVRSYLGVTA